MIRLIAILSVSLFTVSIAQGISLDEAAGLRTPGERAKAACKENHSGFKSRSACERTLTQYGQTVREQLAIIETKAGPYSNSHSFTLAIFEQDVYAACALYKDASLAVAASMGCLSIDEQVAAMERRIDARYEATVGGSGSSSSATATPSAVAEPSAPAQETTTREGLPAKKTATAGTCTPVDERGSPCVSYGKTRSKVSAGETYKYLEFANSCNVRINVWVTLDNGQKQLAALPPGGKHEAVCSTGQSCTRFVRYDEECVGN